VSLAHLIDLVAPVALQALGVRRIAVQFDDVVRRNPRGLMQIIDVLGYHRRHLAAAVEARECAMSPARTRILETVLHGEPPTPGLLTHLAAGAEIVEIDR